MHYEYHINVEIFSSIAAVKYLLKNVYHDCAIVKLTTLEEAPERTLKITGKRFIFGFLFILTPVMPVLRRPFSDFKGSSCYLNPMLSVVYLSIFPKTKFFILNASDEDQETVAGSTLEKANNMDMNAINTLYDCYKIHMMEDFVGRDYSVEASEALLLKALCDLLVTAKKNSIMVFLFLTLKISN